MSGATEGASAMPGKMDPSVHSTLTFSIFRVTHRMAVKASLNVEALTYAGQALQMLQLLFFSFSPAFFYTMPFFSQLQYAVAFFSGPLFDRHFGAISYLSYTVVLSVVSGICLVTTATFAAAVCLPRLCEIRAYLRIQRALMEAIGGWLLLPMVHLFLGGMVCETVRGRYVVVNFPSSQCADNPLRLANIVLGSIGLFSVSTVGLLLCWLFDDYAESRHPLSRPHGYHDIFMLTAKLTLAVVYHMTVPPTRISTGGFAVVALVVFLLLLGELVVLMPYVHRRTASLQGLTFATGAYLALINIFAGFRLRTLHPIYSGVKTTTAFAMVPLASLVGWHVANVRVSAEMENALETLHRHGITFEHIARLPLPRSHGRTLWYVPSAVVAAVDRDLRQEASVEELVVGGVGSATGGASEKRALEVLMPFIDRLLIPTDVEVASRVLRAYKESTSGSQPLSSAQLSYVLRIYAESLAYFKNSPYVMVALAAYLLHYCDRADAAIGILDELNSARGGTMRNVDYMVQYKAYGVWYAARDALGYRDSAHLLALQRARLHHRQVLASTRRLWLTLLAYKLGDQTELVVISDALAKQRRAALEAYRAALAICPDDTVTLEGIAAFVEDVLGAKDVAQEVRHAIKDIEERKRSQQPRGRGCRAETVHASAGGAAFLSIFRAGLSVVSGGSAPPAGAPGAHPLGAGRAIRFKDIVAAARVQDNARTAAHPWERIFFLVVLYVCVALCFLGGTAMIVLAFANANAITRVTNAIHDANGARSSGYATVYYAQRASMIYYEKRCDVESTACTAQRNYLSLLEKMSQAASRMTVRSNRIRWGKYASSRDTSAYRFLTDGLLAIRFNPHDPDGYYFKGVMTAADGPEVTLYARLRTQMSSVGMAQSMWSGMTLISAYATELINRMRHASISYRRYLQFLTDSDAEVVLEAYLGLTQSLVEDAESTRELLRIGMIVALIVVGVGAVMGVLSVCVNVYRIAKTRVQLAGVLGYIPRFFLEELLAEASDRLLDFDTAVGTSAGVEEAAAQAAASSARLTDSAAAAAALGAVMSPTTAVRPSSVSDGASVTSGGVVSSTTTLLSAPSSLLSNRRFVRALLAQRPQKSCLRARRGLGFAGTSSAVGDAPANNRAVAFQVDEEVADGERARPRLYEPVAFVNGSSEEIIAEFEKSLVDVDRDECEGMTQEGRRLDVAAADRLLTSTYQLEWSRIEERLAHWSRTIGLFSRLFVGVLMPALLLVFVAVLSLSVFVLKRTDSSLPVAKAGLSEMLVLYSSVAAFERADVEVSSFVNFLDERYARRVTEYIFVASAFNDLTGAAQRQYDPTITQTAELVANLRLATVRAILSDGIYCSLAARAGHGRGVFPIARFPYYATFFYARTESDPNYLVRIYPNVMTAPQEYTIVPLENFSTDGAVMEREVLRLHRRARFFEDAEAVSTALETASVGVEEKILEVVQAIADSTSTALTVMSTLCGVFLVFGALALALAARRRRGRLLLSMLAMSVGCAAVVLVLAPNLNRRTRDKERSVILMRSTLHAISVFRTAVFQRTARVEQYIHSDITMSDAVLDEILARAPDKLSRHLDVVNAYPIAQAAANAVRHLDRKLWDIQGVALFLAYAARAKAAGLSDLTPPKPLPQSYDYSKEPLYEEDLRRFGSDHPHLMYSQSGADLSRPAADLTDMARFAVFGLRGSYYFEITYDAIAAVFSQVEASTLSTMDLRDHQELSLMYAVTSMAAAGCFFTVVAIVEPVLRAVLRIAQGSGRRWIVRAAVRTAYTRTLHSVTLAGVLAMVLASGLFVLASMPMRLDHDAIGAAVNSSVRPAALFRSLMRGVYGVHGGTGGSPALTRAAFRGITTPRLMLNSTRQYLYFRVGASRGGYARLPTLTDGQRGIVFNETNGTDSLDSTLVSWVRILDSLRAFTPEVVRSGDPSAPATPQDTFTLLESQLDWCKQQLAWLEEHYERAAELLYRSDDLYRAETALRIRASLTPAVVLYVFMALCIVFVATVVLPRLTRVIARDEEEAHVLIHPIPRAVLDAVPSIAFFVDNGQEADEVVHDALIDSYDFSPNVHRFLAEWKQRDPADPHAQTVEELCHSLLEQPSGRHSGIVVCDVHGTIVFANTNVLTWTRHEGLVGRSVGVLMAPSVAAVHNQFLRRYMRAPQSDRPRARDVMAYASDGERVHVIVKTIEAPTKDGAMYFLAEMSRYPGSNVTTAARARRGSAGQREPGPRVKTPRQKSSGAVAL